MAATKNEATVRTWLEEAWNKGNIDEHAHIFSPSYTFPELPPPFGTGSEGLLKFVRAFRAAFPDLHWTIEDVITNDDKVVWRVVATGTQQAEFMGIPATGKRESPSGPRTFPATRCSASTTRSRRRHELDEG